MLGKISASTTISANSTECLLIWDSAEKTWRFSLASGLRVSWARCAIAPASTTVWASSEVICWLDLEIQIETAKHPSISLDSGVINQGFTAPWQSGPSSFNPQSRFPDHLAESTGRDCILQLLSQSRCPGYDDFTIHVAFVAVLVMRESNFPVLKDQRCFYD